MPRKITHGRRAAEKLSRRWLAAAGVPQHVVGFSEDAGFYLVVRCTARGCAERLRFACQRQNYRNACIQLDRSKPGHERCH